MGNRKITLDECREIGKEQGLVLLSDAYTKITDKMSWRCENGHTVVTSLNEIKMCISQGRKSCYKCNGGIKTYEDCLELAEELDLTLLSNTYDGCKHKLKWRCDKGHTFEKTASAIKDSNKRYGTNGCLGCAGNKKITIVQVRETANKNGIVILDDVYVNAHHGMKCRCKNGHIYHIAWENLYRLKTGNNGCIVCDGEKKKHSVGYYQMIGKNKGLILLSGAVAGIHDKVKWKCLRGGHVFESRIHDVRCSSGNGCIECDNDLKRIPIQTYTDVGKKCGSSLLSSDVVNTRTKVKWKCSKGHEYWCSLDVIKYAVKRGTNGCMQCFRDFHLKFKEPNLGFSLFGRNEYYLFKPFYESFFKDYKIIPQYIVENGTRGKPFFVDLVVPDLCLAIEYDEYGHRLKSNKKYDDWRQQYIEKKECLTFIRVDNERFVQEGETYFIELFEGWKQQNK